MFLISPLRMNEEAMRHSLPRLFIWILKRLSLYNEMFGLSRDFAIEFDARVERHGPLPALFWLLGSTGLAVCHYVHLSLRWRSIMFRSYLKAAFRNILRFKVFSFIKISGLSLGAAACILIYLFVVDELSFDRFHQNEDALFSIHQIQFDRDSGKETGRQPFLPPAVGPELAIALPEIKFQTRLTSSTGVVRYKDRLFRESISLADSAFFHMFSFPLQHGHPAAALADDTSLVLTRSAADKYFGAANPMGEILTITYGHASKDYVVSGIAQDIPVHSSIRFDILIHFDNLPMVINNAGILDNWERWYCPLFVQLRPDIEPEEVESGLWGFCRQHFGAAIRRNINEGYDPFRFGLHNIRNLHLDSRLAGNTGLSTSYLLSSIALVILLIACVNFINLSISSSSLRSMEVGMRKVLGAKRKQIVRQFLIEALVISFVAVGAGIILADLLLPRFNALAGKQLSMAPLFNGLHLASLGAIAVFAGLAAGIYPAFVMSAPRPVDIIMRRLKIGGKNTLTKALVVLQFSLSVLLAVSAVVLGDQVAFLIQKDPGYTSEGLIVILTQENEQLASERLYHRFRSSVISDSRVLGITASNREFGLFLPSTMMDLGERSIHYRFNRVDPDFISTMRMRLIQGRDFSAKISADRDAVIVNQKFMESLGPEYRVGRPIGDLTRGFPQHCRIIGVIEDCHFRSLRSEVEPLLLYVGRGPDPHRDRFSRIMVRTHAQRMKDTITALEKAWARIRPDKPFIYYLQNDALKGLYDMERRWSAIIRYASVVSILLACMGIFGLTAITLSRRIKEIGIRKVLGAGVEQIVYLGIKEFILLIGLANLIAWPFLYFILRRVLENYPYRIGIGAHYFFLAGAGSIFIAVSTILFICLKAALANPVESLRYE